MPAPLVSGRALRMVLSFPPFRLDLGSERLWQGEREVPLRPKSFAVLRYLAERPGRLVSGAELLRAVWPDVAVSDTMPRLCIREIRTALGDDARQPRFLETRPRRGYRLVASSTRWRSRPGEASPSPHRRRPLLSCRPRGPGDGA